MLCPICNKTLEGRYGKKTCSPKCRKAFSRLNESEQERAIRAAEKVEREEHARRYARPLVSPLSMSAAKYDDEAAEAAAPAPPSVTVPAAMLGRQLGRAVVSEASAPLLKLASVTSEASAARAEAEAETPAITSAAPAPPSVTSEASATETRPLNVDDMARSLYTMFEGRVKALESKKLSDSARRKLEKVIEQGRQVKRFLDRGDGATSRLLLDEVVTELNKVSKALPALDLDAESRRIVRLHKLSAAPAPYRITPNRAARTIEGILSECQALEASTSAPRVHLACFVVRERVGQARERLKADPAARVEQLLSRVQGLMIAARRYARRAEAEAETPAPLSVTPAPSAARAEAEAEAERAAEGVQGSVTPAPIAPKRPRPLFVASKPKRGFWLAGDACITRAGRIGIIAVTPQDRAVIVEDAKTGVKARHYVECLSADVWSNVKQWRMREVWAREHTDLPAQYIHIYDQAAALLNSPRMDARQYSDKGQKKQVERIRFILASVSQYMKEGKPSVAHENLKIALEGIKAVFGSEIDEQADEVDDLPASLIEAVKCDIEVSPPAGEHTEARAVSAAKCDIEVSPPAEYLLENESYQPAELMTSILYCGNCGEEHQRAARMPDICPVCGDICTWLSEPPRRRIYTPKKPAPTLAPAPPASQLDAQPSVTEALSELARRLTRPEIY